ncbi:MAG: T9SS type A sorting domain-containing protein, partial [Flavobacteriales bacterium]|nr:T9SS type A sorting domain-containing protein [Flavobacteriales bacterium]
DRVRVRDASGRVVREWRMSMAGPAVFDLGGLVPGAYLMEVRSGNEVATHRLVKLAD